MAIFAVLMAPASKTIARGAAGLVAAALLSACSASGPTTRVTTTTTPPSTTGDTVRVPWRAGNATAFQAGAAEEHGKRAVDGFLSVAIHRPDGAGPFPAVVLLHGCGGLRSEAM